MQKEILPLTSLRFVTALYVFLFHIEIYWQLVSRGGLGCFLMQGACGMSMFFILSGFVLAFRHNSGITNIKDYAFGRFARIYPVYFLSGLVTFQWLVFGLTPYQDLVFIRYFFMVFLSIFMIQAWIPQVFYYWNNGGSWSLSVEMFLYAIFPLVINSFTKLDNKKLCVALLILYVATSVPGISWVLFNQTGSHITFYSMPIFRAAEFMIGVICGLLFARGYRVPYPSLAVVVCIILIYRFLGHGPRFGYTFITLNFGTIPLFALLLSSAASVKSGWLYKILANRVFVYLGHISYSFYAFQALVLMTLLTYRDLIISKFPIMANKYVVLVVAFVTLLIIAALSYHFVETKFRKYLQSRFKAKEKYQPALGSAETAA